MIVFADCQPLWWDIPAHSTLQDAYLNEIFLGTTLQSDGTYIVDELPLQMLFTPEDQNDALNFYIASQDGSTTDEIYPSSIQVNADITCYYLAQDSLHPILQSYTGDIYRFIVVYTSGLDSSQTEYKSNWFALTECEETLEDTAVLRYSNSSNVTGYNTLFVDSNNDRLPFTFRIPAGLKPQGFAPLLDSDEFRNQRQESVSLYSLAYGKYVLTIGHAEGVPYYYADLLNKIFSLDSVELYDPDADVWREVRRSGNAVPQLAETYTGSGMFHITLEIELVQPQIELS